MWNGSFTALASSRDAEIDSSMKMHRYIKLDFVWFFFDWSSRMRMPTRNFLWKSSRMVKSSNTCCKWNSGLEVKLDQKSNWAATYLVIGHESPGEDADLLVEGDLVDAGWQVGAVHVDDVLEVL